MSAALAKFIRDHLGEEPVEDFAKRAGLNASGLYQILRGERQTVHDRTLEKIAAGFGMTLAELAVQMGKSRVDDPKRAALVTMVYQVPDEELTIVERILKPFATRVSGRSSTRLSGDGRRTNGTTKEEGAGLDSSLEGCKPQAGRALALVATTG